MTSTHSSSTSGTTQTYSDAAVRNAIYKAEWRRSKTGLLSIKYSNMMQRVKGEHKARYAGLELLPRSEFIECALNDPTYNALFAQWQEAGYIYELTPSVDRIDNTGGGATP